ncbi:hypothetical protein CUJ84_Chr004098 [Rhizobium leguminosarum]|uniref:Uncharacterized protein n=1 Tax=Rhizobium leguminosarum TaxID=384 RepID=A0A2K9Z838_RHILE|nr:hypothetical protein CUJ84_Chr004098 [Rhizobium leguminosarum]
MGKRKICETFIFTRVEGVDFNGFSGSDGPNEHNEKPRWFVPSRLFAGLNYRLG